ncbi:MAG: hypothetical protein HYU69_16005 [Bacteroidetes bacterium]|nr:hypothetical protein [Bacteroidota bacterium]
MYKTESAMLRFIRNKLPKSNSRKELIVFFKEFQVELQAITKNTFEAKILEMFDFISWLKSKIESKPVAD